ncbi:MAG: UDP-N-acetylglucosamine 1-carboxyvinyltransferase [Patescibacteria group bacterium]
MKFIVNGGRKLSGTVTVSGSKNAATPIIASTILTDEPCVLKNIPRIRDVETMLEILESMGGKVRWIDPHTVEIVNANLDPQRINQKLVGRIRSSILLVGPLLARFGEASFVMPGGCRIGTRPIDTHLEAFKELGASITFEDGIYHLSLSKKPASNVTLREFSVTATENMMMLGARHAITVHLAATEPHVTDLGIFLKKLGAHVSGLGMHTVSVSLNSAIKGTITHSVIHDEVEAGTFAILAAATKSDLVIEGAPIDSLEATLSKLKEMGTIFEASPGRLSVAGHNSLITAAKIETRMYPGIPSDLQAPFGALATQAQGTSLIFDTLYDGRLRYIDQLKQMGADASVLDPHRALVKGPSVLQGTKLDMLDLRAGATLIIAALIAEGETVLEGAEQIDRGYERIDERLRAIGADIQRTNN